MLKVNIFTHVNREEIEAEGSHGLHLVGWMYETEQSYSKRGSKRNSGPGLAGCVTHFCGNLLSLLRTGLQHPELSCLSDPTSEKLHSPTATQRGGGQDSSTCSSGGSPAPYPNCDSCDNV